jgi:hypothetical protein
MRDIEELISLITRDLTRVYEMNEMLREDLIEMRTFILNQSVISLLQSNSAVSQCPDVQSARPRIVITQ